MYTFVHYLFFAWEAITFKGMPINLKYPCHHFLQHIINFLLLLQFAKYLLPRIRGIGASAK